MRERAFLDLCHGSHHLTPLSQVSSRDESFLDLSIDIEQNSSVTACLRQFSASEMLCQKDKFFCDACCDLQEAERRFVSQNCALLRNTDCAQDEDKAVAKRPCPSSKTIQIPRGRPEVYQAHISRRISFRAPFVQHRGRYLESGSVV